MGLFLKITHTPTFILRINCVFGNKETFEGMGSSRLKLPKPNAVVRQRPM